MRFWTLRFKKKKIVLFKKKIFKELDIKNFLALQIFNDLCIVRNWTRLKIIKVNEKNEHLIIGIAYNHKNSKRFIEIFLPIYFSSSILNLKNLIDFPFLKKFKKFTHEIFTVNLAFIDRDSSLSYYRISNCFKKTTGPFV